MSELASPRASDWLLDHSITAPLREIYLRLSFAFFAPLADVAKGGDGAKSAFRGYSVLGKGRLRLRAVRVSGCSPLLLPDLGVPGLDLGLWVTEVFRHRVGDTELAGSNPR